MSALLAAARLRGTERRRFLLALLLAAGAIGAAGALMATSGYLISRAAQRPPVLLLTAAIVTVRALALARAGLRYGERLTSHDVALRRLARLREDLYRRLAPLVPGDLRGLDRGALLSRFVSDVDALQHLHPRGLMPPLVAAAAILGAGAAAAVMVPAAGAALAAGLLAAAAASVAASALAIRGAARAEAEGRSALTGELVEAIDGARELAVAGRSQERAQALAARGAALAAVQRRHALAGAAASAAGGLLTGAATIAVLVVGVQAVRDDALPGVLLAAVVLLSAGVAEAIAPLGAAVRHLHACAASAQRIEDVTGRAAAVVDPPAPAAAPDHGPLAVTGAWVRYEPGDPWALRGASLRVWPGERVAVVGPSGAGKTTLAHLLVRFRDPDGGRVTLGGVDVRRLRQADLREAVALADQDAHVFTTSVRENLRIARRDADDAQVAGALDQAGLGPWLADLPTGLDTMLGEDGATVSGGERRRLAVARALLSPARFLVLDEPTAHLDPEGAERTMRSLAQAAGDRALIVITHQRAGLDAFDRIVELGDGETRSHA